MGKAPTLPRDPPETAIESARAELHGVSIVDDYRWLEGSDAPEVAVPDIDLDARVAAWTDEQVALTRSILDPLPGRQKLESRLRELMEVEWVGPPVMRRNLYFHERREAGEAQPVLQVREGALAEARVLLDPNRLDPTGLTSLAWIAPNYEGTVLAFGLDRAGDENTSLFLMEVGTGEWLADEIPGRVADVHWLPDASGFLYARLAEVENPYSRQIKFHRVGTHHRQDRTLFEQYKSGPLATTWGPFAYTNREARWMILGYWTATDANDLWVVDLDQWLRTGELMPQEIITGVRALSGGPVSGDTLYLQTTFQAPNHRVLAVDLNDPRRERWHEVIPQREDATLQQVQISQGALVARYLESASSQIELFDLDGTPRGGLELPGLGSAALATAEDRTEAFLTFESFNAPPSIYRLDLATGERQLWARPKVPIDVDQIEVCQVHYPSRDGTRISMFLIHNRGIERDGNQPTLLTGYGGFNIARTPEWNATLLPWFEAGGVLAVPNLRGGGEYGEEWHRAGMLEKKQNVFDDFLAAGEWLVARGYTRPQRLAASGGSNGGLLTAAAMVQRPDLFAAVISAVPLLDMVRYHNFLMARYWVPEYGSSEDPKQFEYLLDYSPYHNVRDDTRYPAILLTAAENDVRVHPLHARKMAARLQAVGQGQPGAAPVLLLVDRDAGHGPGKPLSQRIREVTDLRMFILWQLGMLQDQDPRPPIS